MIPIALVAAAACALLLARRRWVVVRVVGDSMAPTIRNGDVLVARRVCGGPLRLDDVVIFAPPLAAIDGAFDDGDQDPALRVKRIAALPGDPVPAWATAAREQAGDGRVPAGWLVVKGDAVQSQDSRHYGLVALVDVVGVVARPTSSASSAVGRAKCMQRGVIQNINRSND
jgi:signal peptidase I